MKKIAIYPGTFDPITIGHLDVVRKASYIFDEIIIAATDNNPHKKHLFTLDERIDLIEKSVKEFSGLNKDCKIIASRYEGLTVDFAKKHDAVALIRGLRAVSDFDFEFQLAGINEKMNPEIQTIFVPSSDSVQSVSSTFVREIARLGGDAKGFVTKSTLKELEKKYKR